jgi:hypothetical protein
LLRARLAALILAAAFLLRPAPARAQAAAMHPPAVPPSAPPAATENLADRFIDGAAHLFTHMQGPVGMVYFPVISANPNSGLTYGILPVAILTNPKHEVEQIIAPMLAYNQYFGAEFLGTYYYYPSKDAVFRAVLERAQFVNSRAALRYEDRAYQGDRFIFRVDTNLEEDGSPRFYGIGPASSQNNEQSYRLKEGLAQVDYGYKFQDRLQVSGGWKFRRTETLTGTIPNNAPFDPAELGASSYSMPRLTLSRDTRDLISTPNRGSFSEFFTEFSRQDLGSEADFQRYGGQWRYYLPQSQTLTAGFHLQGEYSDGRSIPFTELASLGGPRSLRGFPEGRFEDRGCVFGSFEERYTMHQLNVVNAVTEFQVAPFMDVGTVFPSPARVQFKYVEPVLGVAFRAVVKPTVVGRVEVGAGREGPCVYMGIDYPF